MDRVFEKNTSPSNFSADTGKFVNQDLKEIQQQSVPVNTVCWNTPVMRSEVENALRQSLPNSDSNSLASIIMG